MEDLARSRRPARKRWAWLCAALATGVFAGACAAPPGDADAAQPGEVCAGAGPASAAPATRRGLWVLAEGSHRTLERRERVDALIERAAALGVTDLFVQVHRSGRSWFASEHADASPYRQILEQTGEDTLRRLVDAAHAGGVRVHGWFNVFSLAENLDAPLLRALGRSAVLVDRSGRSMLDYPQLEVPPPDGEYLRLDTPAVWVDPAVPAVGEYLQATLAELIAAVPDLDGVHLDFIRYPFALPIVPGSRFPVGLDFGYGDIARARFEAQSGAAFARGNAWDAFRRDQVTAQVARFKAQLPAGWELSAAALSFADRAYIAAMQDWRGWLEEGLLDFAVAMAYTLDDRLLRYWSRGLRCGVGGDRVWLGLGSWLFVSDPERSAQQIAIAEAVRPAGVALFSYDALADAPEAIRALPWWSGP